MIVDTSIMLLMYSGIDAKSETASQYVDLLIHHPSFCDSSHVGLLYIFFYNIT